MYVVDRKSTSRCCFSFGSTMISWFSINKNSMTLSSIEVEYMATRTMSCEAIWLPKLLVGLFDQELDPTMIHSDNQSCIKLFENMVFHYRSKNIEIIYHVIRNNI